MTFFPPLLSACLLQIPLGRKKGGEKKKAVDHVKMYECVGGRRPVACMWRGLLQRSLGHARTNQKPVTAAEKPSRYSRNQWSRWHHLLPCKLGNFHSQKYTGFLPGCACVYVCGWLRGCVWLPLVVVKRHWPLPPPLSDTVQYSIWLVCGLGSDNCICKRQASERKTWLSKPSSV